MRIEKKTNGREVRSHHVRLSFGDSVLERRRPSRVQKGYFTGPVHSGSTQGTSLLTAPRSVLLDAAAVWAHLLYVMAKARLVLVREKRALATPLDVGSQESVTPVSTATKSAGESVGRVSGGPF